MSSPRQARSHSLFVVVAAVAPKHKKPAHRPPAGKTWDSDEGKWVDGSSAGGGSGEMDVDVRNEAGGDEEEQKEEVSLYGRKFQSSWRALLPWLVCVSVACISASIEGGAAGAAAAACPFREGCTGCSACSVMMCTLCMERGLDNSFAKGGSTRFLLDEVNRHQRVYHRDQFPDLVPQQCEISERLAKQLADEEGRLKGIMMNVYWLAKENIALWKLPSLCRLCAWHGVFLGRNYINHVMARDMAMSLAHVLRERINTALRMSPAFALMVDESTDVSSANSMVLYVRLFMNGVAMTVLWGLVQVTSANADGLVNVIEERFKEQDVSMDRLFCFASDGASVMTGDARDGGGVAVKLQAAWNVFMVLVHCIAHRLALGCADACEDNPIADCFDKALHGIVGYHSYSPKRKEHLHSLQEKLQIATLRMVRMVVTRWLSRGQTTIRIFEIIAGLLMEFTEDADAHTGAKENVAAALQCLVFSHQFVTCLCLFRDILESLNHLSASFQKSHPVYSEVRRNLASLKENFRTCYKKESFIGGPSYLELKEAQAKATSLAGAQLYDWRGISRIASNVAHEQEVIDGVAAFSEKLISGPGGLDERFPEESSGVLATLDIFNFDNLPTTQEAWNAIKGTYGNAEIHKLKEQYGVPRTSARSGKKFARVIDPTSVVAQWGIFRDQLWQARILLLSKKATCTAAEYDKERSLAYKKLLEGDALPDVKVLCAIHCIICLSTVWCERGFSLMSIIKTKLRNCMNIETLDALMMISSNGPDLADTEALDQLIAEALEHWKSKIKRCVARSHPGVADRKPKPPESMPLSDLLEAQARAAVRRVRRDGPRLTDEDSEDEETKEENDQYDTAGTTTEGGSSGEAAANTTETAQIRAAIGPYSPRGGWKVSPQPASTQPEWDVACNARGSWTNKKLAHIFDDGWRTGTYKRKYLGSKYTGVHWVVYYGDFKEEWVHSLLLSEYGLTKSWVVVEKE